MAVTRSLLRTWPVAARVGLRLGRPMVQGPWAQVWWLVLLRAFVASAIGVGVLVWPRPAMIAVVMTLGVFALVEGLLALAVSAVRRNARARPWTMVGAMTSLAAGAAALTGPGRLAAVIVMATGVWLVLRGIAASCEGLAARRERRLNHEPGDGPQWTREEGCVLADGVIAGVFGLAIFAAPHVGALGLVWAFGAWAILHGVLMAGYALELRRT